LERLKKPIGNLTVDDREKGKEGGRITLKNISGE